MKPLQILLLSLIVFKGFKQYEKLLIFIKAKEMPIKTVNYDLTDYSRTKQDNSYAAQNMTLATPVSSSNILGSSWYAGATYYISSSTGNDANTGTSSSAPRKTIPTTLSPGNIYLLSRGDIFYNKIGRVTNTTAGNTITIGAYGTGSKPVLSMVVKIGATAWVADVTNVWKVDLTTTTGLTGATRAKSPNIGFLKLNETTIKGAKKTAKTGLAAQWDFFSDATYLYVYSTVKPSSLAATIEASSYTNAIDVSDNMTIENIKMIGAGKNGISAYHQKNIIIRNCDIVDCGGSYLSGLNNGTVRAVNGIQLFNGGVNNLIENNYIKNIYDAALTMQAANSGALWLFRDCIWRGNTVDSSEQCFENTFLDTTHFSSDSAGFVRCRITGNNFRNAGYGWSHKLRPNKAGVALLSYQWFVKDKNDLIYENNTIYNPLEGVYYAQNGQNSQSIPPYTSINNDIWIKGNTLIRKNGTQSNYTWTVANYPSFITSNNSKEAGSIWHNLDNTTASKTYFISKNGDNTTGTSPATAWQTISKLNSSFSLLQPGDKVLFTNGQTFYGTITVTKSGVAGNHITFGSFGTGPKPVLTTLSSMTEWISTGNNIYTSAANLNLGSVVNVVTVDGIGRAIGRYPNVNAANKGYLIGDNAESTTTLTDAALPATPNWTGAEVVIRTRDWALDKAKVTSHSGSTIKYTSTIFTNKKGYGYFFQNDPRTLDLPGEWYYNSAEKKLSIYSTSLPTNVKAAALNYVFDINSFNYITIDNLNISGANTHGIYVHGSGTNVVTSNCNIEYNGGTGFRAVNYSKSILKNCTLSNNYDNGAIFNAGSYDSVVSCNILNTHLVAGMGRSGNGHGIGLNIIGSNRYIAYNVIRATGYTAFSFTNGSNNRIYRNVVDSFCLNKDNGGGIYSYNSPNGTPAAAYYGNEVLQNVVSNSIGAKEGTISSSGASYSIYMDSKTRGVLIEGNTIYNSKNDAFRMNNNSYVIVRNNTVYNTPCSFYHNSYDNGAGSKVTGNQIKNNVFFAIRSGDRILYFNSSFDDIKEFGVIDSNYYCRPINEPSGSTTSAGGPLRAKSSFYSLDKWQAAYPAYDQHSKKTAKTITAVSEIRFEVNPTNTTVKRTLGGKTYMDPTGVSYTKDVLTLQPYSSKILLITPSVPLDGTPANVQPSITFTNPVKFNSILSGYFKYFRRSN